MKKGVSLLSEVRPMQAAPATQDGVLFRPLLAGIPPLVESGEKLCAAHFHRAQAPATAGMSIFANGGERLAPALRNA